MRQLLLQMRAGDLGRGLGAGQGLCAPDTSCGHQTPASGQSRSWRPALWAATLAGSALAGCATVDLRPAASLGATTHPTGWHAPLPHGGSVAELVVWWERFGDPLLPELMARGQQLHPDLAAAWARVGQARALAAGAQAAGSPVASLGARGNRSRLDEPVTKDAVTSRVGLLDAAWEIDLVGGRRAERDAAQARLRSGELAWHEARVSLAVEIASALLAVRTCEATTDVLRQDRNSAALAARLVAQRTQQGFDEPRRLAQAEAQLEEARAALQAQQAECDLAVRTLAALVVMPEDQLRERLATGRAAMPQPEAIKVPALPLDVLAQRPDVAAAEQALVAAAAEIGVAEAHRWPRLNLTLGAGSGAARLAGASSSIQPWAVALGLMAPVLDGGARRTAVDAAVQRHAEAHAQWRSKALLALRDVDIALTRLAAARQQEAYLQGQWAQQQRWLEDARQALQAGQIDRIALEAARRPLHRLTLDTLQARQEHVQQWLSLVKALGGGWQAMGQGTTESPVVNLPDPT